jgi:hypothetical protein
MAPWVLRIYVGSFGSVGNDAGRLYAISTFGSLAGALLSAYVLVPFVGAKISIFLIALLFGAMGLAAKRAPTLQLAVAIVLLAGSAYSFFGESQALTPNGYTVVKSFDSDYYHFRIAENPEYRLLMLDADAHSEIEKGGNKLVFPYVLQMASAGDNYPVKFGKVGLIGMGAGSLSDHFAEEGRRTEVYEIDPQVYETARDYFNLTNSSSLEVHIGDARALLAELKPHFTILMLDAYASKYSIPVHLATKEAFGLYAGTLPQDGLLAANIISAVDGPQSAVFRSISASARPSFPYQAAILLGNGSQVSNIVLLASKEPFLPGYLDTLRGNATVVESWGEGTQYTDDRSSLDYDMMQVLG